MTEVARANVSVDEQPDGRFFVSGPGTHHFKEHLKALGGIWNSMSLVWIIPKKKRGELMRLLSPDSRSASSAIAGHTDAAGSSLSTFGVLSHASASAAVIPAMFLPTTGKHE